MKKTNNPVKIPIRSPPPPKHPINTPKKSNPSFFGTIMEGFAFGTGSSIARETVGAIFNKPSFEKVNLKYSCEEIYKMYEECNNNNHNNSCSYLLDKYEKCILHA